MVELSDDFLKGLIDQTSVPEILQEGPVRWSDKEMRCVVRGCSSPTYIKLQGVPRCMIHTVRQLNELLVELGVMA